MKPTMARKIVIDAVMMAVWRRKPNRTLIRSNQGSEYGSDDWLRFCREHQLEPSMSRRDNCWGGRSWVWLTAPWLDAANSWR